MIARFNQFNYVGALLGAVMTGLVGAGSLRVGFAVPMVLVLGDPAAGRAFAPTRGGFVQAALPQPAGVGPGQFLSGWGTGRPGCSPPRASR